MTSQELRGLREGAGLTATQLAAAIGVAAGTIHRYEAGVRRIPGPVEIAVRTVLGESRGTVRAQRVARKSTPETE